MNLMVKLARYDDVATYRALRLMALEDSPSSFGASLAEETAFDESQWLTRIVEDEVLLLWVDGVPAGLSKVSVANDVCWLKSVWLAPEYRGKGIAGVLIGSSLAMTALLGHKELLLWVGRDNLAAMALYARHGFNVLDDVTADNDSWVVMAYRRP